MALYICIAIFLIAGLLLEFTARRKDALITAENSRIRKENRHSLNQMAFFVVVIFTLWFLTAFRSAEIGNDTAGYMGYFRSIATFGINPNFKIEVGYQYFCLLVSRISLNPYFFLGVVATICYLGSGIYIYRYSDNIVFSTVLLFPIAYGFFASGLRQSIAMIICLYAYQLIKNKKIIFAVFLVVFASFFHTSALLMLVLLFHKIIPKKPFWVISLTAIFIALSVSGVMDNVFVILTGDYASYYKKEGVTDGWLGITYYCLRALAFYFLVFFSYGREKKRNSLVLSLFSMLLFTVSFGFSLNMFNRATNYFMLIATVELPNAIYRGGIKRKRVFIFLVGFIMVLYFIVTLIVRPQWEQLYPYQFNWS